MQRTDSWKIPDAGKDWGQEEKGMTEDEMVGWHHQLNGHGFGWTLGVGDGQGGLACCGSWSYRELDRNEQLNWTLTYTITGFPGGSDGKESACNAGDWGLIPGSRRRPGKGNGYPLRYSFLENSMTEELAGHSSWSHKESDTTEWLTLRNKYTHSRTL